MIEGSKKLINPKILKETEKAYLIEFGLSGERDASWFPMSVVYPEFDFEGGLSILRNIYVNTWFLDIEEIDWGIEE